ncbi:hypothetical protein GCM10028807_57640 [Spirosoma daeguense]
MKKLLFIGFGFCVALLVAGKNYFVDNMHLQVVTTMSGLKEKPISPNTPVFVLGKSSITDGFGAIYTYDSLCTDAEDMVNLNAIKSSVTSAGCWRRLNVKTQSLPGGMLFTNGGKKEYFTTRVTDSNGEATINLTTDNTSTGTALFTTIYTNSCVMTTGVTSTSEVVTFYPKSVSADKKVTVHKGFKNNPTTVSLLGLVNLAIAPLTTPPSGLTLNCKTEGL